MILALLGLKSLATFMLASLPALSLSNAMITFSKSSKNSRLSLISVVALPAPRLIETTAHLLPSSS